jgi:hypothetical protein
MRTGLGWRSLDPVEAVAAVHAIDDRKTLIRIAQEAMHPEARRMALLKLQDKDLMAHFALYDTSPIVRRRMVRELDDVETVRRVAENDIDSSVRESACARLEQMKKPGSGE